MPSNSDCIRFVNRAKMTVSLKIVLKAFDMRTYTQHRLSNSR